MSHFICHGDTRARFSISAISMLTCLAFLTTDTVAQSRNTDMARQAGLQDGRPGGEREGRERGAQEGYRKGFDRGEDEAYRERLHSRRRDAYQFGYAAGYPIGEQRGQNEGDYRGRTDGEARGQTEGQQDGERRASLDATNAATPPGRQKGISEADLSDAPQAGRQAGIARGDQEAQDRAQEVDYPQARRQYQEERFAEPIVHRDTFSQTQKMPNRAGSPLAVQTASRTLAMSVSSNSARPDYRYLTCSRSFPTNEERQAYTNACREGYGSGFQMTYADAFRNAENQGLRDGRDRGRSRADKVDVRPEYQAGYNQGEIEGYRRAYDRAYEQSFRLAYNYTFPQASQRAYDLAYPTLYERAFEAARLAAYRERYQDLFNASFAQAKQQTFDEKYPQYAANARERGRRDEESAFAQNPLRLVDAQISKDFASGLFEPNEALRFTVDLRNFAASGVAANDVSFTLEAGDGQTATIPMREVSARQGFRAQSLTRVTEVLEARLFETAVGRTVTLHLKVKFQGRVVGQKTFELIPQFMLSIQFAAPPQLREGMETMIRVKVKNISQLATDAGAKLQFLAQSEALEILDSEKPISALAPGATTEVAFRVVGKRPGDWVRIPMAFLATLGTGRRVGVFDITDQVPIINDYGIEITEGLDRLRQPGMTRVEYVIKNESSRLVLRALQLTTRVRLAGPDTSVVLSEDHVIVGPNPQYLTPIMRDFSRDFLVPVLVKNPSHANLVFEMELQEEGKTVVIHRRNIAP